MKEGALIAGRYRLLRPIGMGATGTVWAARHELLGREFALKIAGAGQRTGLDARARFLREVQIVGKLRHPNIVDIADAGEVRPGEGLYLAMELLEGKSLAEYLAADGPMPPSEALAVATEVCRALSAAHGAGVVHRDIKPANIFLANDPRGGVVPKLLDFGVSSARGVTTLKRGGVVGTPAYMSPEQALGQDDVDHRTDLWSLGVVLYEMMSGRRPFTADSYPALLPLIIEAPHPALPASVPAEARTVVAGCLAKDRADRYPSADALLEALRRARAALPAEDGISTWSGFFVTTGGQTGRPPPPTRTADPARSPRHGLALAIFAVPVFILIAAAASGLEHAHAPPPGRDLFAAPAPAAVPPPPRADDPGAGPVTAARLDAPPVETVEPVPPSLQVRPVPVVVVVPPPVIPASASAGAAPSGSAAAPTLAEDRRKRTGIEPAQDSGAAPHRF